MHNNINIFRLFLLKCIIDIWKEHGLLSNSHSGLTPLLFTIIIGYHPK
jgi:hypothetical protein